MWLVFTNRFIGFRLLELLHWRHLVLCDKGVAGSSSLEILATFSNNIMKKHGSEKLTDEAIEETLEKVVKLLACISDKDLFAEFYGCIEVSRDFYQTKTMHRKLTWIYSFGTCNINGKFEPKTMELIVTTYQVPLLLADEKEVIEDVDKDGGMLSMCIVKSQKVLNHQGYGECVEQLSHMFKLLEHGMKISGSVVNISGGGY